MLLAALLHCGGDRERLLRDLAGLDIGPLDVRVSAVNCGGLSALRVDVAVEQEAQWQVGQTPAAAPTLDLRTGTVIAEAPVAHPHRPYRVIRELLERARLPESVRARAQRVFRILATAEGAVHGVPADDVEFHEVGARDAIVDVVGCCLLLEQLGVTRVTASPIVPGHGTVYCAHGRMPVPVPAVARMLVEHQVPWRDLGWETGELTTPTGAALVIGLADAFVSERLTSGARRSETGTLRASGFGAGHKMITGLVNVVRCLLSDDSLRDNDEIAIKSDEIAELTCHLDDCTGEQLAAVMSGVIEAGALDVAAAPLLMKKGRPGQQLIVLTKPDDRERLARWLLTHSSTIGLRWRMQERWLLPRRTEHVTVAGHVIALKVVTLPDGDERAKPEADDVARVATALGQAFARVQNDALAAWRARAHNDQSNHA